MTLSEEEKRFIACFFEWHFVEVKPKYENYISLFSYLDKTDESISEQKRQIEEDDPYFVNLLRHIVNSHQSEKIRKRVIANLIKDGFFENKNFKTRFNAVVDWLLSNDSKSYLLDALREKWKKNEERRKKATEAEKEKLRQHYLENKEAIDSNYQNAMVKLATNGFKKASTHSTSKPPSLDTWGVVKKSKLEDDGNSWREQK